MVTTVSQISVFVENKPGRFALLTGFLSDNNINLRAFSVAETRDFGVVRLIVDDPYKAARVLKEAQYIVSVTPVIAVEIPDEPGGLLNVLNILGSEDVNVAYMYALLSRSKPSAYVIIRVDDNEKVTEILSRHNIRQLDQDELVKL